MYTLSGILEKRQTLAHLPVSEIAKGDDPLKVCDSGCVTLGILGYYILSRNMAVLLSSGDWLSMY
jgi:hypothetical protein